MKTFATFSLGLSVSGVLIALPFVFFWWNLTQSFGETFPFLGFLTGFLFEIIAFGLALTAAIIAAKTKRRNLDYLIPKLFLAMLFVINVLGFGVFLATMVKLIITAGGAMK